MEDFILELLGLILEPIIEALVEYVFGGILDLLLRALRALFNVSEIQHPAIASLGYALLGLLMGGISLMVFPHRIVRRSRMPGISLIVVPVIVGLLMSWTRRILLRHEKSSIQIESFGYGFAFALGMTLIRLQFAR